MLFPATGWFEIVKATNKLVTAIQAVSNNNWLTWYPLPQFIVFDTGATSEREFKQMREHYGINNKS
jgi:hypothetical protein